MFVCKNKYFLIIESIKDIDLKNIKLRNKFYIVYRNLEKQEEMDDLHKFKQSCKLKGIKFLISGFTNYLKTTLITIKLLMNTF